MELTTDLIKKYEIEDFNESKDMPSLFHARLQSNISYAIKRNYIKKFDVYTELLLSVQEKEYVVDVCVYPAQKVDWTAEDQIYVNIPPLIAIEILSPKQFLTDLTSKAKVYFAWGVKSCWIVIPSTKIVIVQDNKGNQVVHSSGKIADLAGDLEIDFEEVFM
jgi:Uma2 family endonuclease